MSEVKPDPRLARVLAMANWKGGVGKTTLTANLGNTMAGDGMHILLVDLDLSGNLAIDLGLSEHPEHDQGHGLMEAIKGEAPLYPIRGVRPGLDWIPGGMDLRGVTRLEASAAIQAFHDCLAEVAGEYDMVILDCPPNHPEIIELALGAARYVLVPTKSDPGSWDGIGKLGPFVRRARATNPSLTWLGIAIFDVDTQATSVLASLRFEPVGVRNARAAGSRPTLCSGCPLHPCKRATAQRVCAGRGGNHDQGCAQGTRGTPKRPVDRHPVAQ